MTAEQDPLAAEQAAEAARAAQLAFAASARDHAMKIREFAAANELAEAASGEVVISIALAAARRELLTHPAERRDFELTALAVMSDPDTSPAIHALYGYLDIQPASPKEIPIVQERFIKTQEIARRLGILENATATMIDDLQITLSRKELDFLKTAWMDICASEGSDQARQARIEGLYAALERAGFSSGLRYILDQLLATDFTTPTPPTKE